MMKKPSRERIHALIRENGRGELLDEFIAIADRLFRELDEIDTICAKLPENSLTRRLAAKARSARWALNGELDLPSLNRPYGSFGQWGANMNGGRIAGMLRDAKRYERSAA